MLRCSCPNRRRLGVVHLHYKALDIGDGSVPAHEAIERAISPQPHTKRYLSPPQVPGINSPGLERLAGLSSDLMKEKCNNIVYQVDTVRIEKESASAVPEGGGVHCMGIGCVEESQCCDVV